MTILKKQRLRIPYVSQNGEGAQYGVGDCGIACVTALCGALGYNLSVDNVGVRAGLLPRYKAASINALQRVAAQFGITLVPRSRLTAAQIGLELDAGRPVIALTYYPLLPKRRLADFRGGHFIVVHGYHVTEAGTTFFYDDPEWLTRQDGEDLPISASALKAAMWQTGDHARYPANGLLLRSHQLPLAPRWNGATDTDS